MRQISNKELEGSKQTVLIDVRELGEFKGGHIQGAKNIPLSQLNRRLGEIPKDRDLLLYCRSGMRSKSAARILMKNGFTRLAHLRGGISAWTGSVSKR
ncbi:rhodanese-like domain-containing protein [Paenibacillus sp. P25]|nr:rhodanese-like domain-containing protein [Paenibacillus sp. P25]